MEVGRATHLVKPGGTAGAM